MNIIYNILFFVIGFSFWFTIIYIRAHFMYTDKEKIDKCFKERKDYEEENKSLKVKIKKLEEDIENLKKELEQSKREIVEKNKYLSEDKVVIERLAQVKELSNKISDILLDYDKETIQHLLEEYRKKEKELDQNEEDNKWW